MRILGLCLIGVVGLCCDASDYGESHSSFTSLSKQEFCSGDHHVRVNPKNIPQLLEYLKYCSTLSKQPNVDSFARRQSVIHLFNAATPVMHKAFFDSRTALKYVVLFTKLKHEAIQYANYANKYGDHSMYSRKKVSTNEGTLAYSPENDEGSYDLNEDLRLCASILNRQQNTSVKNIIKPSQLPRVAKAARIITFPPFNLSVAVSSDDTPYMILDMYVLAMRCLSFTNLHANTTMQVSENLISNLKRKVMPFVPPHEFEKAYTGMMSLGRSGPLGKPVVNAALKTFATTPSVKRNSVESKHGDPVVLKLKYISDDNASKTETHNGNREITLISSSASPVKSFRDAFAAFLRKKHGKVKNEENSTLISEKSCHETCHEEDTNQKSLIIISIVLGVCGTLAVILYCLLFGCCGWLSVSDDGACEHDEVDDCLDCYTTLSQGKHHNNKCYCTLADSNQMDVIAALHQRCEQLSKKICQVVREISKENVLEDPASMDVLREFVRSVSANVVDENETVYHFGKSMSSFVNPQNKISSVNQNTL